MSTNICPDTHLPLPADLAGFQLVCSGEAQAGDLLVDDGKIECWVKDLVGLGIKDGQCCGWNVYRRIPVPKPGDTDVCPSTGKPYAESKPEPAPHHSTVGVGKEALAENDRIRLGHLMVGASATEDKVLGPFNSAYFTARATKPSDKAATHDEGKAPLAYLPWAALDAMAQVQAYGHKKYGNFYNYRKGLEVGRNLSCAIRHIRDYMNGEDKDHESGQNPLAHALTRIAFVLQNLKDGTAIDDRFKGGAK